MRKEQEHVRLFNMPVIPSEIFYKLCPGKSMDRIVLFSITHPQSRIEWRFIPVVLEVGRRRVHLYNIAFQYAYTIIIHSHNVMFFIAYRRMVTHISFIYPEPLKPRAIGRLLVAATEWLPGRIQKSQRGRGLGFWKGTFFSPFCR